jgi:hypothetical protein
MLVTSLSHRGRQFLCPSISIESLLRVPESTGCEVRKGHPIEEIFDAMSTLLRSESSTRLNSNSFSTRQARTEGAKVSS